MSRIRALGLLTLSALAFVAAFGTVTASASWLVSEQYPASVVGEGSGKQELYLGKSYTCSSPTLAASVSEGTPILNPTATSSTCGKYGEYPFMMNRCITLHPGPESAGKFPGTFDVDCNIRIRNSNYLICDKEILPQTGLAAEFENVGSGSAEKVKFMPKVSGGLQYKIEGSTCPGVGTYEDGSWSGSWEFKALNASEKQVGFRLSEPLTGLSVSGGNFIAESYPFPIGAEQSTTQKFLVGWPVECTRAEFVGQLTGPSSSLNPLLAEYPSCTTSSGAKGTVEMNSCHFGLNAGGTVDIECEKEGDAIVTKAYTSEGILKCTSTISPQKGIPGASYTNVGSGNTEAIKASLELTGITYSTKGKLLGCAMSEGVHTGGMYVGSITLKWWFFF